MQSACTGSTEFIHTKGIDPGEHSGQTTSMIYDILPEGRCRKAKLGVCIQAYRSVIVRTSVQGLGLWLSYILRSWVRDLLDLECQASRPNRQTDSIVIIIIVRSPSRFGTLICKREIDRERERETETDIQRERERQRQRQRQTQRETKTETERGKEIHFVPDKRERERERERDTDTDTDTDIFN